MPIDPTIVTGLMPQAPVGPSAAMLQAQEAQRAAQEKRREEAELRQILASAPDDETAIALLNRSGKVDYATKLRDQLDKHRQSVDQTYLNDLKKDEAETGLLVKVAQSVTNQSTLDAARQLFSSYSPEGQTLAQQLPQTWDETAAERMRQFVQMGLTAEQHSKAQQDSYDKLMSGDWDRGTAELLATADTPDEAQGVLAMLQARRAPKAILDRFAPLVQQWSPATRQHVADMALSEKDRRTLTAQAAERQAQAASRATDDQRMAATAAETARHNRAMEARPVGGTAAGAGASGSLSPADARLVEAIIKNPGLYDKLTPTTIGRIAGALDARGFAMGQPLSNVAVTHIAESESAINSLKDLRDVLKANEQYIGPIAGLQGLNPWSDARKAQANIDTVRQRVGKALEGGVLRKEDEEKYKKILATLTDTPSTAIYKVDQLIKNVQQNIETYKNEQRAAGRRVGAGSPDTGGGIAVTDPNGKVHHFETQAQADTFKQLAGIK